MSDAKRRLEGELVRLRGQIDSLERDWQRLPRMLVLAVLAVPAGVLWGALAAALVALAVMILVGVGGYLIQVRKNEYRTEMETVQRDLRTLERQR